MAMPAVPALASSRPMLLHSSLLSISRASYSGLCNKIPTSVLVTYVTEAAALSI